MELIPGTGAGLSRQAAPDPAAALMRRPLIIGASVSADWSSLSPGKKLALE